MGEHQNRDVGMNTTGSSEVHFDLLGRNLARRVTTQELSAFSLGWSPPGASRQDQDRPPFLLWRKIMSAINDTLNSAGSILNDVVRFGIGLAGAFLVVQVLFPGTVDIIGNVAAVVGDFTGRGLTGLITLLLFMTFMRR